jgi:hypothetical protein
MKRIVACGIFAVVAGCAARQKIYYKPGGAQSEFEYVRYDCSMKARQMHPVPWNADLLTVILVNSAIDSEFDACMGGYGWHLQQEQSNTTQVPPVTVAPDVPTTASDDAIEQARSRLKWIDHLKNAGAISSTEYDQYRSEVFAEHPDLKP